MRKTRQTSGERIVKDIKRKTRKRYSAEEKIRIVLDGLRGEESLMKRKIHLKAPSAEDAYRRLTANEKRV